MLDEAAAGSIFRQLRIALRSYGRRRFPALREEIDDLASQALSDLWEYLETGPGGAIDAQALRRLAFSIFRRRAADVFRGGARLWALSLETLPEADQLAAAGGDPVQSELYRRMLRVCLAELGMLSQSDRILLSALVGECDAPGLPMSARDRQRLHRLRVRLRDAVRRELGEDVRHLLREDI